MKHECVTDLPSNRFRIQIYMFIFMYINGDRIEHVNIPRTARVQYGG